MKTALAAFFLVMFFSSSAFAQNTNVIINEIMYSPSTEFGGTYNEWVELYNPTNESVNITGWNLTVLPAGTSMILSGTIPAGGYFIIDNPPNSKRKWPPGIFPVNQNNQKANAPNSLPERDCTWCKIPMTKRLVGEGRFIHYTCPSCIFQHTSKQPTPSS